MLKTFRGTGKNDVPIVQADSEEMKEETHELEQVEQDEQEEIREMEDREWLFYHVQPVIAYKKYSITGFNLITDQSI